MNDQISTQLADGLTASEILSYTSTEELSKLLASATDQNQSVVPFGGKVSLGTGYPAAADLAIDMTSNAGIIAYTPEDLTLSVKAGTTWAELQATLAEQGQSLPLDIPHPARSTVGGVVATGFAGARRYRNGSLRDLLIGCEYVRGDGLVARAGGMVVKNVSGFEIPRFLHGSWGSLAVLTSVNLKVMPKVRAEATVLQSFPGSVEAIRAGLSRVAEGLPVDAISVVSNSHGSTLAIRATGRPRSVDQIATALADNAEGNANRLADEDSAAWWQSTTNTFAESTESVQIALSIPNEQLASLSADLQAAIPGATILVLVGSGSIRARINSIDAESDSASLQSMLAVATRHGASWVIESAPTNVRSDQAVWGQPDSGLPTMTSVKRSFDPGNVLNRGRLFI